MCVFTVLKSWEYNGMEEISLVTPPMVSHYKWTNGGGAVDELDIMRQSEAGPQFLLIIGCRLVLFISWFKAEQG